MTIAQTLLLDFDAEAESTRRVLERVPEGNNDWKPRDKSMSLGTITAHVAGLPSFGLLILTTPAMNMPDEFPSYHFTTAEAAVSHAAGAAAEIRTALNNLSDEDLLTDWSLNFNGQLLRRMPRAVCYRVMFFNHLIHHRGQFNVYLRLLDIAVPGIYGPSADEPFGG